MFIDELPDPFKAYVSKPVQVGRLRYKGKSPAEQLLRRARDQIGTDLANRSRKAERFRNSSR